MAKRGAAEQQAIRMYGEGRTLEEISTLLDVSVPSLSRWKTESRDPVTGQDEWDRARAQKRGNIQRLRDLFEDQLLFTEGLTARERTAPLMDTLSKMGSLLEKWDKLEKAQRVAEDVVNQVKKAGLTDDTVDDIRRQILGIGA